MSAGDHFNELAELLKTLRALDGCPWDREQTIADLAEYMLEEAFECHAAAHSGDASHLCEELGDVLLQIVFMSQIASENDHFDLAMVAVGIVDKIKRRHPHIFGDEEAVTSSDVNVIWNKVKQQEGKTSPTVFPALETARRVQLKAAGRCLPRPDPWEQLERSVTGLLAERNRPSDPLSSERKLHLVAEVMFSAVLLCSHLGSVAERLLRQKNNEFARQLREVKASDRSPEEVGRDLWPKQ